MILVALGFGLGAYVVKLDNVSFAAYIAPGLDLPARVLRGLAAYCGTYGPSGRAPPAEALSPGGPLRPPPARIASAGPECRVPPVDAASLGAHPTREWTFVPLLPVAGRVPGAPSPQQVSPHQAA